MTAQLIGAAAGVVIMAAPSIFGYDGVAADIDHIIGPLAVSVGIVAASQILRSVRWIDAALGIASLASLLFVSRGVSGSIIVAVAAAVLVVTPLFQGSVDVDFGGGWAGLVRPSGYGGHAEGGPRTGDTG